MSLDVYLLGDEVASECGDEHGATREELFESNVTHNLNRMAEAAGIYEACWRPESLGIDRAGDLAPLLRDGLRRLRSEPDRFRRYNPANGWGTYEVFVRWLSQYADACERYPDARVEVSR